MRYAIALIVLVLAGCPSKVLAPGQVKGSMWDVNPNARELTLGVGDVLQIDVWSQKDLNTQATVRPDGTLTMPLVGDIKAVGMTPSALKDTIYKGLQAYVKMASPSEVSVAVTQLKSYRFTVQGEVGRPGQFSNDSYVTVSEAIALAGGPTRFAKRNEIQLFRRDAKGAMQSLTIDYDLVASGKREDLDVWILAGDTLYVP